MSAAFRALRSGNGAERNTKQRVLFCSLCVGAADEVVKGTVEVVC